MGFGKDGKGAILWDNARIEIGALASQTAIQQTAGGIGANLDEDFRILKIEYSASIDGFTVGEGPIVLGLSDGELSNSEIGAPLSMSGPIDFSDRQNIEYAERPVFLFGTFDPNKANDTIGDGEVVEKVHRWTYSNSYGWKWYVFNRGLGTLTTGANVFITAKIYGVWLR